MEVYLYPVHEALIAFPVTAMLFTLPYMFINYRKYGSVLILRSIIWFSFILYLQCAYYLVILPLPDPASVADNPGPFMQLVPFHFVSEFLRGTSLDLSDLSTLLPALKEPVVLQPLFNLLLTLPFGVYLAYYFKAKWKKVLLFSFLLSVFFEVTQLTGLYGIYAKPYRLFDVDDLLLNTLGGMAGYALSRYFTFFLPSREDIDKKAFKKGEQVSYPRRFFALIIDFFVMLVLETAVGFIIPLGTWGASAVELLYLIGLQYLWNGKTVGKRFVRIRTASIDGKRLPLRRLAVKYTPIYIFLFVTKFSNIFSASATATAVISIWLLVFVMLFLVFMFVDFILSYKRGKRLWYELLSRTRNVSTIQQKIPSEAS